MSKNGSRVSSAERSKIRALFESLTVWSRGDQRAPHKPLLILYALGRWLRGEAEIQFSSAKDDLARLLTDFGPPRKVCHPEQPFWRLQKDGIWTVRASSRLVLGKDGCPSSSELIRKRAKGQFRKELQAAFRRSRALVREVERQLLAAHFPTTLHDDIRTAVGLDVGDEPAAAGERDPNFRRLVLMGYEHRCAVCGLQLLLSGMPIALEAAHIKWHQAAGPASLQNGLALCVFHHKVFDLGAFTISRDLTVVVSDEASGLAGLTEHLLAYHGKPISRPIHSEAIPAREYIEWHRREVFRGRPRP
jgi:putative restriction endonuclease